MSAENRHHIDILAGQLIRERRKKLKMSQQNLADEIKLTFQQVQKYEKGANRVSASKLWEIAQKLNVPISYFFQQGPDADSDVGESETKLRHFCDVVRGRNWRSLLSGFRLVNVGRY